MDLCGVHGSICCTLQGGGGVRGEALLAVPEVREPVHLPVPAPPAQPVAGLRRLGGGGREEGAGPPDPGGATVPETDQHEEVAVRPQRGTQYSCEMIWLTLTLRMRKYC